MAKKILSVYDVAERFGVDYSTVRKAVARGEVTVARKEPSGDIYFLVEDLPALAERFRRELVAGRR